MHPFCLDRIILHQGIFLRLFFLIGQSHIFQLGELGSDIGQYEELRVIGISGNHVQTFIGQLHTVIFFIDYEKQRVGNNRHITVVFLHIILFCLEHQRFYTGFTEIFNQCRVLRKPLKRPV